MCSPHQSVRLPCLASLTASQSWWSSHTLYVTSYSFISCSFISCSFISWRCEPISLQECLTDGAGQVAALGLQSIAHLCADDTLDFYGAWRVAHQAMPTLPQHVSWCTSAKCVAS